MCRISALLTVAGVFLVLGVLPPSAYAWTIPRIDLKMPTSTPTPTIGMIKPGLQIDPGLLKVSIQPTPTATPTQTPAATASPTTEATAAPETPTATVPSAVLPTFTVMITPLPEARNASAENVKKSATAVTPETLILAVIAVGVVYFVVRDIAKRLKKNPPVV